MDSTITNAYKILGGVTMGHFLGMAGGAAGGAIGYYWSGQPVELPPPPKAFYGACAGSALGHAASIFMGHHIAKTPENKTMGNAQMVYSGLGIGIAAITAALGRYIIEEQPATASLKIFVPAVLIGKSPGRAPAPSAQRRLGNPKTDEERAATHLERYGTTDLPPRGTGLSIN